MRHPIFIGVIALLGLPACVYVVERPPHRRPPHPPHHEGGAGDHGEEEEGWEGEEDSADWSTERPAIWEGPWVFSLSNPRVEGGDCSLEGLTELTVEGHVVHTGPSSVFIETPLATLEGEVFDARLIATGTLADGDVQGQLEVNAALDGITRLSGIVTGDGEGCVLRADLVGYALTE